MKEKNNQKKLKICYFGFYEEKSSRNKIHIESLRRNGVEVIECNDSSKSGILQYLRIFLKHWKIRNQYDLMIVGHLNTLVGHSTHFIVPFARLISRKKIIYNALCSPYEIAVLSRKLVRENSLNAKIYWLTDYLSCRCASLVLVESEEQRRFFIENFKIKKEKCIRIWTGTDDNNFFIEPVKKNKIFTVIFRGGFSLEAGVEHILEAAKKLKNEDINFLILGRPKTEEIEQKIKNTKNVKFVLGHLPFSRLRKLILSSHIILGQFGNNERTHKTIPYKAFEAMALRIPYLTGEALSAKELFTDRLNCLFAKLADPDDIAQKILELKNNPELRKKIADNGYKLYQEKLNPKVLGKEILEIIKKHKLIP